MRQIYIWNPMTTRYNNHYNYCYIWLYVMYMYINIDLHHQRGILFTAQGIDLLSHTTLFLISSE